MGKTCAGLLSEYHPLKSGLWRVSVRALIRGLVFDRAQKNGEDGEDSTRTEPNLMDSLVPKQRIKQTDRQTDITIQTDSQKIDRKTHRQTDIQVVRQI